MAQQPIEDQRFESFPQLHETPEEIAFELRAQEGALWTGSRLLIGIFVFAFASLAFAYFYLRSANNENLWRPGGITAPTGTGAAIFAVTVASALIVHYGEPDAPPVADLGRVMATIGPPEGAEPRDNDPADGPQGGGDQPPTT